MTIGKALTLTKLKDGNIAAGAGYSTDSQQTSTELCYNATISQISPNTSTLQLDIAQSFYNMQKDIGMSVSIKGGIGMFSTSDEASYLQSMQDTDYSFSLNYYYYISSDVNLQILGYSHDALTISGNIAYGTNATYPFFGLICGDQYITSYSEGAMLLMGINIQFNSNYEKEQFNLHVGASFGDIFSASGEIEKIANKFSIVGSVAIQATQIGGNPALLADILNKDVNGNYYALTCSLNNMQNCLSAADGMLDYAVDNFTTQVSFENNIGLTPLSVGLMPTPPDPMRYLGLETPPSFVTPEVVESREALAEALLENQYYQQKFYELLYGYPVAWDTTSNLYANVQTLYKLAQSNIETLTNPSEPGAGGLGCFAYPDQCTIIAQNILNSLNSITSSNLTFLTGLNGIQYAYQVVDIGAYVYKSGDNQWSGAPSLTNYYGDNRILDTDPTLPSSFNLDALGFNYSAYFTTSVSKYPILGIFSGTSDNQGMSFYGSGAFDGKPWSYNASYTSQISPFYFEPYNSLDSHPEISGEVQSRDVIHV
jgi:hypothetical protein